MFSGCSLFDVVKNIVQQQYTPDCNLIQAQKAEQLLFVIRRAQDIYCAGKIHTQRLAV